MQSSERLVAMANQIGIFFVSQGRDSAPRQIADHMRKFWDPRMRDAIEAHLAAGGEGLTPEVRLAIEDLVQHKPR